MKFQSSLVLLLVAAIAWAQESAPVRPKAGKVEIMKISEVQAGMKGYAWTVFSGTEPEPVPVEIIGVWKNANGPKDDVILAKMGGKAVRTNVAGGMSGSPVYMDGKLIGAVALRFSVFSPDAICGITPIEQMLEIKEYDNSQPRDARAPGGVESHAAVALPSEMLARAMSGSSSPAQAPTMTPIETPLSFSGFSPEVLRELGPMFQQLGVTVAQGGAGGELKDSKPGPGWENSLQPGEPVIGVLVSGDMSMTGMGTVTYNDGRRILAFGHPFFNLGPVEMPMSKGEILMTLASSYQPNKFGNATEIVGALRQDRHNGIMGTLGEQARTIPVTVTVRSFGENNTIRKQQVSRFNVFVNQKWTPTLMMTTLLNTISSSNDFTDENTIRFNGKIEMDGRQALSLTTMQAPGDIPVPAGMALAGWWGDKFTRLFGNSVDTPSLNRVDATVDILPDRRVATIENAWVGATEALPGDSVPVKVFLRPYRGDRLERAFNVAIPEGLPRGEYQIFLSDADSLNRMQKAAANANRFMDVQQTASLLSQERSNNQLYVSLVEMRPTVYYDDKTLPSLPASVLNVMQSGHSANKPFVTTSDSAVEQAAIPFDYVINGSYSLKISVK
jgi:hypothetical protein